MTLAFHLEAVQALAAPAAVFDDARGWSRFVGVVGDDAAAVERVVDQHGLGQEFELGSLDTQSVLSRLKWEADTDRYVYIGTDDRDRALADFVNWEYRHVQEAAAMAGWELAADRGPLARLRDRLPW